VICGATDVSADGGQSPETGRLVAVGRAPVEPDRRLLLLVEFPDLIENLPQLRLIFEALQCARVKPRQTLRHVLKDTLIHPTMMYKLTTL
jgi:hypothetical protein